MSISVKKLTKVYGQQTAVNAIDFTINTGEIVGFLGPNGAGKSTTMKMITGFLESTSGEIEINQEKLNINSISLKREIGYLPEANPLYTEMYVAEYLRFMAEISGVKSSEIKNRVEEIIEKVGLSPERNKKIEQLSKGYKQRVGLAQALIHDPKILILDEPTTGLDPNQLIEIRNLIKQISKNKTIILSTHIMQEVEAICNRVIIINKGNLVADMSLAELKAQNQSLEKTFRELTQ